MNRFSVLALICLFALTQGAGLFDGSMLGELEGGEDGGLFDGELKDRPILRAMLMKKLFGQDENTGGAQPPFPLIRAMMSQNAQMPVLRAMLARQIMQGGQVPQPLSQDEGLPGPLRAMILFRLVTPAIGKKIVEGIKERKDAERVYTFQTTLACDCALNYVDDDGEMKGFSFDLIRAVCEEAGKQCRVQYDTSTNCVSHDGNHPVAGEGLMGKHYDACEGWVKTTHREHILGFTKPYWKDVASSSFYIKPENPTGFDPADITDKKIGFMSGWVGDHSCLTDITGYSSSTDNYVYFKDRKAILDALEAEEVSAIFLLDQYANNALQKGYVTIGESRNCAGSGDQHMITRKDNDLSTWWDEALTSMMESGKYYAVCNKARVDHGHMGEVQCITDY
uniref:Uncharacterized protein LOC100375244 n=1 Tax=Saccoglossus kowalevskii TaxID=10224 RepID=A0ABM0MU94_SACKO|nr:PREDICTED: uncharacterized protein LOC100375244 [Saccoglossus kowalevskii]